MFLSDLKSDISSLSLQLLRAVWMKMPAIAASSFASSSLACLKFQVHFFFFYFFLLLPFFLLLLLSPPFSISYFTCVYYSLNPPIFFYIETVNYFLLLLPWTFPMKRRLKVISGIVQCVSLDSIGFFSLSRNKGYTEECAVLKLKALLFLYQV